MKPKFALLAALVAGLLPVAAVAQAAPAAAQPATPAATSAPTAPAPAAAPAAAPVPQAPVLVPPSAFPARIALISFERAVAFTNEGQRAQADVQKKYQPQREKLEALSTEIDSLKKQLQAAPATLSDEERAARLKTIDTKQKQLDRDTDDAQTEFNTDMQEALSKISSKFYTVMTKYANDNGYTIVFDVTNEQTPVLWAVQQPNADITFAVIDAYNTTSKVAPLPPAAPAAAARPKPASTTTPRTTPAAKPAAK